MSDHNLKKKIIRLAYQNPDLRGDLLPLLNSQSDPNRMKLASYYWKMAWSSSDSYTDFMEKLREAIKDTEKSVQDREESIRREGIGHLYSRYEENRVLGLENLLPHKKYLKSLEALQVKANYSNWEEMSDLWEVAQAAMKKNVASIELITKKSIFKRRIVDKLPGYTAKLPSGNTGIIYDYRKVLGSGSADWAYLIEKPSGQNASGREPYITDSNKGLYRGGGDTLKFGKKWLPLLDYLMVNKLIKPRRG